MNADRTGLDHLIDQDMVGILEGKCKNRLEALFAPEKSKMLKSTNDKEAKALKMTHSLQSMVDRKLLQAKIIFWNRLLLHKLYPNIQKAEKDIPKNYEKERVKAKINSHNDKIRNEHLKEMLTFEKIANLESILKKYFRLLFLKFSNRALKLPLRHPRHFK